MPLKFLGHNIKKGFYMITNKIFLEHKCAYRVYQFLMDSDSPLGEIREALFSMQGYIINKIIEEQNKLQEKQVEDGNQQ